LLIAGCRDRPQRLVLRDSLTARPIRNALVMMELEAVYDASTWDPMPGVRRRYWYNKWLKKALKYGYDYTPKNRPFVPGFYYNPAAFEEYPFVVSPGPDQVRLQYISDGWKIFYSDDSLDDNRPSYMVSTYYIFKPGFLPVTLTPKQLEILENKQRRAVVAMRIVQAGTMVSDRTVIYAAEDVLAALPEAGKLYGRPLKSRLLLSLATLLRDIVELPPGGGTYKEFPGAQALARKHLARIHEMNPAIPGEKKDRKRRSRKGHKGHKELKDKSSQ
jgi:hypothetical protein